MKADLLIEHLSSILLDTFNLSHDDIEKTNDLELKCIKYGLLCLHEDLQFHKERSDKILEDFKQTLFDSASISITNSENIIKNINPLFVKLTGFSKKELIGNTHEILDSGYHDEAYFNEIKKTLKNGKTWKGEFCNKSKSGSLYWIDCIIFPIKDINGNIYEYWNIINDITEKKKIEQQMAEFSYLAAHDLQEPLRVITSYMQLLNQKYRSKLDDKALKYINYSIDSTIRMKNLIDNLLTYSKTTNDNIKFIEVDMNFELKTVLEDMAIYITENSAIITIGRLPFIKGVPFQMRQLFQNLISNGIKFTPPGQTPEINISCEEVNGLYKFYVIDNGIGIEEEYLTKIFTVFKRLNNRSEFEGTGIGLAICDKIVSSHHGKITVESKINEGTSFCISLPKN